MALTVGELTALMTVDASGVAPGLRRAESALETAGRRMGADAESAGRHAGEGIGTGLASGAEHGFGRLGDSGRAAGHAAGEGLGEGMAGEGERGAEDTVSRMSSSLGKLKVAALGIGATAGAALLSAFGDAIEQQKVTGRLTAQLGATPAQAQKYGKAAGQLYKDAVVGSFQEGADAIRATMQAGLAPPGATVQQLAQIGTKVSDVASTFELDLGETATSVGQLIRSGMAKDATEGIDLITKAMQHADGRGGDLLETVTEYTPIFEQLGLSGKDAFGLVSQGLNANAKDSDKVADALKELSLQATSGGAAQIQSLKDLGLNATQVADDIAAGGARGRKGIDQVLDALREMPKSTKRAQAVQNLFGGPGEDLGAALFALDVDKASKSMDNAGGAADRMGDSLRDNAATKVEKFKRTLQQNVVDFLGDKVIPALQGLKSYVTKHLGGLWDEAGKGTDSKVDQALRFVELLGQRAGEKLRELGPKMISWLQGAGKRLADFIVSNPEQILKVGAIAAAITAGLMALPGIIAAALVTSAAIITTRFTAELISKTGEKLPLWWASFQNWISQKASEAGAVMDAVGTAIGTWFSGLWSRYVSGPVSRTWDSWVATVRGLPSRTVAALSSLGSQLASSASGAWQRFRSAAASRVSDMVSWTRGIPHRIDSAIGNLGGLLYGDGQDVVRGLWAGIRSMGSWLASQVAGFVSSAIPGPVKRALGIASPSKVMARDVGRWIPAGIVDGIQAGAPELDRTMANLVSVPSPQSAAASARAGAAGVSTAPAGGGRTVLEIRTDGTQLGAALVDVLQKTIRVRGGNVQAVLGR